jgi:FkbM family methyltransferase
MPWTAPYVSSTTQADILACFRLLLGRMPNPEEWRGHSMRVGEELPSVVASYLNSLEFFRRDLIGGKGSQDVILSQLSEFSIYSDASDAAVGKYVRNNNYELEISFVFRNTLKDGMRVVDIGANIGYFTLLSASLVGSHGQVLAIEPNPRNVRLLEASRRANGFSNVTVSQTAVGRETGLLVLNTSHSNGTTSGLPVEVAQLLRAETVPCVRLDSLVPAEAEVDFIKVDVEGAEYNALLGGLETIRRCRPIIVSEVSPAMMPGISGITGADYLLWLVGLGYDLAVIEADGSSSPKTRDSTVILGIYEARGTDHIDVLATPQ